MARRMKASEIPLKKLTKALSSNLHPGKSKETIMQKLKRIEREQRKGKKS